MKALYIFSILLIASAWADNVSISKRQIAIPQKCEDVLSVKACDKIKSMAESVKLKAEAATEAVVNAVKDGKRTAEEIYQYCERFYLEKVKAKKCEDFVSAETCKKLRVAGENLKVKAEEVEVFVKKALLEGKKKAVEVYDKVVEYYENEIKGKSCEELLTKTPQVCTTLKNAATAVKVKAEQVTVIVKEALINGYNNATAIAKRGIEQIKNYAANFTCEDLLNPNLCSALREYSRKFKVAFPKIMATVRDLLVKGYQVTKGFLTFVYKITDAFIDCEHIFTNDSCALIHQKVTSLGGKLTEIGKAVREFATQAINTTKDIYHKVLNFTKSKWCKYIKIGCSSSDPSVNSISKRSTIDEQLKIYKEMLKKGIAAAKQQLQAAIVRLMNSMNVVDQTLRNIVEKAIQNGNLKYEELKLLLKKLVDSATGKTTGSTDVVDKTKRDLMSQIKEAFKKAHGHFKVAFAYLLKRTTEELKRIHNYISTLIRSVLGSTKSKRELDDEDLLEQMANELVKMQVEKIASKAEGITNEFIDEAIVEAEEDLQIKESGMVKRDVTNGMEKVKELFGKIGDKVKDVLSKLRSANLDDIKTALKNAGLKLIGVAEELYKKIIEALQNNGQ